jgi:hypothetical protein
VSRSGRLSGLRVLQARYWGLSVCVGGGVSRSRYLLGGVLASEVAACAGGADGRGERGLNLYIVSAVGPAQQLG